LIVKSKFRPSWWLRNPHLQTLWASKVRRTLPLTLKTERLELADGDFVDLAWNGIESDSLVCLFHGLAGCAQSAYANHILVALRDLGVQAVLMHFRGCSGEPNRLAVSYHSGHTDDIRFVINTLAKRFPNSTISAIGYSLGGNALLKYLAEENSRCPLRQAIAVSPPLVLQEGAKRMNQGFSKVYQRYLLRLMRQQLERKRAIYPQLKLPMADPSLDTFWRFDDAITAPLHGFKDVHDYYSRCSSRQFLSAIKVPCHILHSRDDPFFSPDVIPAESELAQSVTFEIAERGGHVAFVAGANPCKPHYWLEQRLIELLGLR